MRFLETLIELEHVGKSFIDNKQTIQVLRDVNLEIKEGEFISLMGESGSGKSTLLYIIAGFEFATSGEVKLLGKLYTSLDENSRAKLQRNNIGFVFQFYNLIQNLNVEDNILLPISVLGKKRAKKQALEEILEYVGLEDKRKKKVAELSGGEQQRVAVARAILMDMKILLADEPTGNLDHKNSVKIMELFQKVNQEKNMTILQVTHSKAMAEYGSKIYRLQEGILYAW